MEEEAVIKELANALARWEAELCKLREQNKMLENAMLRKKVEESENSFARVKAKAVEFQEQIRQLREDEKELQQEYKELKNAIARVKAESVELQEQKKRLQEKKDGF